jgi:hypothetical protein
MRILVLFSILLGNLAAEAVTVSKPVISARQLILKKDRIGALQVLASALEKDIHKQNPRTELIREMDRLSKVFFTEDGQKNFELAESLLYLGKPGAAEKYEEALKLENMNAEVLMGLARARLSEGNCSAASHAVTELEKINPHLAEKKILKLKAEICLKRPLLNVENDPAFKEALKTNYKLLQAEVFFNQSKLKEAEDALKEISDEKMPETAYWNFKVREVRPHEALLYAEKYLDLCKAITPTQRREYKLEPLLCSRTEEVKSFLTKNEASK